MKIEAKKIVVIISIVIVVIIWITYLYNKYNTKEIISPEEQAKLEIDEYNFEQLEKVKNILRNLKRTDTKFSSLKEFNNIYNSNIKPIKNCYYINKYNNKDRVLYNFWFKLESDKYIKKYWDENYIYPKYDLPISKVCFWLGEWGCYDLVYDKFNKTISNPCQD